jgi:hypothetical protein
MVAEARALVCQAAPARTGNESSEPSMVAGATIEGLSIKANASTQVG